MSILLLIFLLATAVQCLFLWWVFPAAFQEEKKERMPVSGELPPVSVIVCFRNESSRLTKYQSSILAQDYPNFEVVAVDDCSTDDSAQVIQQFARQYPHLRLVRPPAPTRAGKKDALTYGISQARHDILLLTDADCQPATRQWLRLMTAPLAQDPRKELVLGVSPYRGGPQTVNHFQQFETLYTAFQYLGLARRGLPYMGVGRNLAYRKRFFQGAGGLEAHAHLPGGDDDLLVSHHAQSASTAIVTDPAARTLSDPASSWRDYYWRKLRHLGVGIAYPLLPKLLLGALALSHVLFYGLGVLLLAFWPGNIWVLGAVLLRLASVIWVYTQRSGGMLPAKNTHWWHLLGCDAGLCFYYLLTGPGLFAGRWIGFGGR